MILGACRYFKWNDGVTRIAARTTSASSTWSGWLSFLKSKKKQIYIHIIEIDFT